MPDDWGRYVIDRQRGGKGDRCILSAYATGVLSRSVAMIRLGYIWYGPMKDAMSAAGLSIQLPEPVQQRMDHSIDAVFGEGALTIAMIRIELPDNRWSRSRNWTCWMRCALC